jgi:hypothetical protein
MDLRIILEYIMLDESKREIIKEYIIKLAERSDSLAKTMKSMVETKDDSTAILCS